MGGRYPGGQTSRQHSVRVPDGDARNGAGLRRSLLVPDSAASNESKRRPVVGQPSGNRSWCPMVARATGAAAGGGVQRGCPWCRSRCWIVSRVTVGTFSALSMSVRSVSVPREPLRIRYVRIVSGLGAQNARTNTFAAPHRTKGRHPGPPSTFAAPVGRATIGQPHRLSPARPPAVLAAPVGPATTRSPQRWAPLRTTRCPRCSAGRGHESPVTGEDQRLRQRTLHRQGGVDRQVERGRR
ncbi:hypothetical protein F4561_000231 [Lipingzhangella halophila]|uniref:Uncharacterized protein n=1 Tax=Lipingzhangella halophila TaxID=1783352 RepID=A0A7W7RDI2_9ACTN|nr:hypothetical protein [Lipingzhangella halophila]